MKRMKQAAALAVALGLALVPLSASTAQAAGPATHKGMTWQVLATGPDGTVQVGGPQHSTPSDPYNGDTLPSVSLPVLCINVDDSPAPDGISIGFYSGWSGGTVALSQPVKGSRLNSQAAANSVCQASFGIGWRQAEFHDGRYGPNLEYVGGWSFWAYGNISPNARFWTAINDQQANPWN
ncbi:hypothetical protein ABZW10_07275 [Kitasatospora sp. NPDC004723]|uniref:hypothetical protein n=1 Tax=Kitasatospora sp. NPDC004723 TaxID=3154288 RepID=UPI00339EC02A